ncbi:MAG: zinc-binding dehydrogenase [Actinomycetota bacterium]|nr:zinc-binding dehydrogenase [Actinomycetota bacterium]
MVEKMLAARFFEPNRPLELEHLPVPEPGPLDVLVKVKACGICLSDVHLMDGSIPPVKQPVIPGHEASGTVEETGELVVGWPRGVHVSIMGGRNCGSCVSCRTGRFNECRSYELMGFHYDGAWAEFVSVPYYTLSPVPGEIPAEEAAILADAVATPYAALLDTAELHPGETVGLWGIGGLGTHAVQLARLLGAGIIVAIDPLNTARERALRLGADVAIDPSSEDVRSAVRSVSPDGLDIAVDLVGSNAVLKQASSCLARRGRCVMVGLSMERVELGPGLILGTQSQSVRGHLGYDKRHLDDLVRLLAGGRLDLSASITDVMPLEDVNGGVTRLAEKRDDPVRLVVRPG